MRNIWFSGNKREEYENERLTLGYTIIIYKGRVVEKRVKF